MAVPVTQFEGETVAVMGLGRSGLAAARALIDGGAHVRAWDDSGARRKDAAATGIPLADLAANDAFDGVTALVLSPGIPHTHPAPNPVAARAKAAGCPIIGDIELLIRACPEPRYVGVTGTNGKSTTTALLGHVLEQAGIGVAVGGNLGQPALTLARLDVDGVYVLEMSSYQLELTPSMRFDVAVLLNVSADHLDRHGGMEGYVAAKRRIFANQGPGQAAVVGVDDAPGRQIFAALSDGPARVVPVSCETRAEGGVYLDGTTLIDAMGDAPARVVDLASAAALPGRHNAQNVAAAYAAARLLGVETGPAAAAILSYPGLPHRQQVAAVIDGVTFVNDSKATNAEASAKALASYAAVYWIAGGQAKEGGLAPLLPLMDRVKGAFLIGEAGADMAATLSAAVPCQECGTLAVAIRAAQMAAQSGSGDGAVVLLSPACASFDQFDDFEDRGDTFCRLVAALPGDRRDIRYRGKAA